MCSKYPNFDKATKVATHLLYRQDLSDRVLDVENLVYDKPICFDSLQNYALLTKTPMDKLVAKKSPTSDGVCVYDPETDLYVVLYNALDKNAAHRNWTIAHEVGHVYLDHKTDGDIEEVEAHFFVGQLFMPEYTLLKMNQEYGMFTPEDLSEIFGVSIQSAEKRIITFNKKSLFNGGYEAKEIWKRQKPKIDLYYKCKENNDDFRFFLEAENYHKRNADYFNGIPSLI